MALIVIITGYSSYTNGIARNVALLESGGHTVVVFDDDFGVPAPDFSQYHLMISLYLDGSAATKDAILEAYNAGTPLINAWSTSSGVNYHPVVASGLCDPHISNYNDTDVYPSVDHYIYSSIGITGSTSDPISIAGGTTEGCRIATPTDIDKMIAMSPINSWGFTQLSVANKGELNSSSDPYPANIAFVGFMNGQNNDYTTEVGDLILSIVDYVAVERAVIGQVTGYDTNPKNNMKIRIYDNLTGLLTGSGLTDVNGDYRILTKSKTAVEAVCLNDGSEVRSLIESGTLVPDVDLAINFDFSVVDTLDPVPNTVTAIIAGNITKLGLPYEARVTITSNTNNPKVVGTGVSDINGDYSIDVAPYTENVLIHVSSDFGVPFEADLYVYVGHLIHPTNHDGQVYRATTEGLLGSVEPTWNKDTTTASGDVLLAPEPLFKPLTNGYVKPVVTPI